MKVDEIKNNIIGNDVNGVPNKYLLYERILKDQVIISYNLHIPFLDTDSISPQDRELILVTLKEIREAEKEALEEAKKG